MRQYIIPGILLCMTLFFAYLFVTGPIKMGDDDLYEGDSAGKVTYDRVLRLKAKTKHRMELNKEQAQLARTGNQPLLEPGADRKNRQNDLSLNEDAGPAAHAIDDRRSASALTIDQKMDEFLAEKQQYEEMEKQKKQEFIRRFVEESYRMGYDIQINDQMEIISVRKIGE